MLSTSTRSESSNAYSRSTSEPIRLIWHRHDLRLHDNELYSDLNNEIDNPVQVSKSIENVVITQSSTRCVSLFVFDTTYFKPRPSIASAFYDTVWTGPHAARVLIDAVSDLRNNLASIGGKLLVRVGDPTIIVPQIAQEIGATEIFYNEEPGTYENEVSRKVKECYMGNKKCKIETKVGYTLNHPNDLPSDSNEWNQLAHPKDKNKQRRTKNNHVNASLNNSQVLSERESSFVDVSANRFKGMSKIMGDFRKAARNSTNVRKPLPAPSRLETPDILMNNGIAFGTIPSLENLIEPIMKQETKSILGLDPNIIDFVIQSAIDIRDANLNICKGETEALKRLDFFIKNKHAAVADRSKADVSNNDSSRLSVHFALGTLSPRTVYWKANEAYDECKWLMSHLEMRDFFLYTALAADHHLFQRRGIPLGKNKKK